jgi:WD40 repeat protein
MPLRTPATESRTLGRPPYLDSTVYSGSSDETIEVWSPDDGALLQTLDGHARDVTRVAVGPDGNVFFCFCINETITAWSSETGAPMYTLHGRGVCSIAVGSRYTVHGFRGR